MFGMAHIYLNNFLLLAKKKCFIKLSPFNFTDSSSRDMYLFFFWPLEGHNNEIRKVLPRRERVGDYLLSPSVI